MSLPRSSPLVTENKNKFFTRHILSPVMSGLGKSVSVVGILSAVYPDMPGGFILPGVTGGVCGISNFAVEYHFVTKSAYSDAAITAHADHGSVVTWRDQMVAAIVFVSAGGVAFSSGYKTMLKTGSLPFAGVAAYISYAGHIRGHGQKWFGETNKNLGDTWLGYVLKSITLDFKMVRENIIDINGMTTELFPAFEAILGMTSIYTFAGLLGVTNLPPVIAASFFTVYAPYFAHKGFGQEVMRYSVGMNAIEHHYLASVLYKLTTVSAKIMDVTISLPGDVLSIVLPPKFVLWTSILSAGATSGYTSFAEGLMKLPHSIASQFEWMPEWGAGLVGVLIDGLATSSHFIASWDKTILVSKNEMEESLLEEKVEPEVVKIGIKKIVKQRFDEDASVESRSCGTRITARAKAYYHYLFDGCIKTIFHNSATVATDDQPCDTLTIPPNICRT